MGAYLLEQRSSLARSPRETLVAAVTVARVNAKVLSAETILE